MIADKKKNHFISYFWGNIFWLRILTTFNYLNYKRMQTKLYRRDLKKGIKGAGKNKEKEKKKQ